MVVFNNFASIVCYIRFSSRTSFIRGLGGETDLRYAALR